MSKTILVTGAIGSGKSEVCRYLASKGFSVYDSDSRTKALYENVPGLKERVEEAIGVPFSGIDIIFRDKSRREALEKVVYPEVLKDFEEWRKEQKSELIFFESAIALEKPEFDGSYQQVLLVQAPEEVRFGRNPKARERSRSQEPIDPSRADFVIINDGSLEELYKQIDTIMENNKTDLSKILAVAGQHGLYRFLALSRGNAVIAESLEDGHRTIFDARSRVTTLADIAIYTSEGELKLKEVFLAIDKALAGAAAPATKGDDAAVKALFEKAVPNYDAERFYTSHMKKILEWYKDIVKNASLDFAEEEEDNAAGTE